MKSIIMDAYLQGNLGDDLFIKIISERYSDTTFYLINKYDNLSHQIKNLQYINISFFVRVFDAIAVRIIGIRPLYLNINKRILKKADGYIKIGGSLFMQNNVWKQNHKFMKNILSATNESYIVGANFGPYETDDFFKKHEILFSNFKDVCFRDYYSFNLFSKYNNIRYAPDIVFNLDMSNYKLNTELKNPYVIFSIINLENKKELAQYLEKYENKLIDLVNYYTQNNIEVKLISFCEYEGDLKAINRVYKKINNIQLVEVVNYQADVDKILEIFANSSMVIATRLHSMILGLSSGIPTLPIIYNEKMTNILEDMKFEGHKIEIPQIEKMSINDLTKVKKIEENIIKKYRLESNNQFKELDKLLLK